MLFSDSESVNDLETATLGNLVAAKVATPPISRSRRVNFAIHLSPVIDRQDCGPVAKSKAAESLLRTFADKDSVCTTRPKSKGHSQRATVARYERVKPETAVSQASGSVVSLSRLINDA